MCDEAWVLRALLECLERMHRTYVLIFVFIRQESGEKLEAMSRKEAALFPLYASCALVGLYLFFKVYTFVRFDSLY